MKSCDDKVTIAVQITKEMHKELLAVAKKQHRNLSQVVRLSVIDAIQKQKKLDARPNAKCWTIDE